MIEYLSHDLNAGHSWGLEYPLIYGFRRELEAWVVWDRHSGKIAAVFPPDKNTHGFDFAEKRAIEYSMPDGYNDEFIDFDAIP